MAKAGTGSTKELAMGRQALAAYGSVARHVCSNVKRVCVCVCTRHPKRGKTWCVCAVWVWVNCKCNKGVCKGMGNVG